jgi:hypothetical protein
MAATVIFGLAAASAAADAPSQVIQTPGALTEVRVGSDLSCQVRHVGDSTNEFFPPSATLGDCGTFLGVGSIVYGPDFANNSGSSFPVNPDVYTPFTSVVQSPVSGTGTAADPFKLVTTVTAGDTGLGITETDTYVAPNEAYQTDIVVTNTGSQTGTARVYRGADCYLQGSDIGFGFISAAGAPACSLSANNSPSGQIEELAAQTPGFKYVEGAFLNVWNTILTQAGLPNTCDCDIQEDNGVAVSWDASVPAGGSATYTLINNFSNVGQVVGAPSAVTLKATPVTTTEATLTGQTNPEGKAVTDCHFNYGTTTAYGSTVPCAETLGGSTTPVPVSAKVQGLAPGQTYHYLLSVTTDGGTTTGADQTVTTADGPGEPQLGETANLLPVTGTVFVKLPKGSRSAPAFLSRLDITKGAGFIPVTEARQIPIGSQLDARRGTVDLVAGAANPGITQTVRLSGAVFNLDQADSGLHKGLTTFTLKAGAFPGAPNYKGCPATLKGHKSTTAQVSKSPKAALQTLKAKDQHGKFRTSGKYSAGTVRGTSWSTTERCDGTLTKVKRGIVDVRDFALRKTIAVKAGHRYLAKASSLQKTKRHHKKKKHR